MNKKMRKTLIMRGWKLLHILVITALFILCAYFYYVPYLGIAKSQAYLMAAALVYFVMILLLGRIYRIYMVGTSRIRQLLYSQGLTILLSTGIGYVAVCIFKLMFVNPLPLLGMMAVQLAWCALWCFLANRMYFRMNKPKKTVVIYAKESDLRALREIEHFDRKFEVIRQVQDPGQHGDLERLLVDADTVFLAGADLDTRNAIVKYCVNRGIQCYFPPRVGDVLIAGSDHMQAFSVPLVRVQRKAPSAEYLAFKRGFDIFASCLAIILTSPFMLVTAIAIKAYDKGPVLYKQVRLTKDRREFKVLKFRSMRVDAEKDGVARLSTENDDRITPVGKIIRKIRFDELPQLFNILKGEMTIVGPRPERPEIAEQYEKEIPSFGLRLQVKAGLTGYAQVYGRYNTEPYDKLKMDLMYINHMSVAEDLRIMLATVKVLFMKESTEGIEEGQTTASHKEQSEEKEMQNV